MSPGISPSLRSGTPPDHRHFLASAAGSLAAVPFPCRSTAFGRAPKEPLKYLQIGTSHAHASKMGVYRESPDWDVIGVVEPDPELAESVKKSKPYADLPFLTIEQGLNTPGLKAVGIETEVKDLLHHAELAINAGFHIHLDKPAGESLAHFPRICEKADRAHDLAVQETVLRAAGLDPADFPAPTAPQ